jgi:hypothetical protein
MSKHYFLPNAFYNKHVLKISFGLLTSLTILSCDSSNGSSASSSQESGYPSTVTNISSSVAEEKESVYKGNRLENGASPLQDCFGSGKYAGHAWIEFKNGNSTDAIVCLVNLNSGRTIRNEYIQAGTDFKMTKIPSGTYYLKIYQGNDWNPTIGNFCGTKGGFESEESFSKSDDPTDHIQIKNSSRSYTTGSITLYQVSNGNMSTASMSPEAFFNN